MKTPRYTDLHKFPKGGYRKAVATDIRKTWEAARKRIDANATEAVQKVEQLKPRIKARA